MTNKPDSEMTDNTEDAAGRRDSASRGGADAAAVNDETDAGAETAGPVVGMTTERAGPAPDSAATEAARDTTAAGGPAPATPSGSAREPDAASTDEDPEARPPAAADDGDAASGSPDATAVASHESLTRSEAPSAETEETEAIDDAVLDGTEAVPVAATAGAAEAPASAGASEAAADAPTDTPVAGVEAPAASLAAAEEAAESAPESLAAEPVLASPAAADEEVEPAATGEAAGTASKPAEASTEAVAAAAAETAVSEAVAPESVSASTEAAVDEAEPAAMEEAEQTDGARDISRGQWFFVQTLSGKEFKAKASIDRRIAQEEMEEIVFESIVPIEKVTQVKLGKKMTINRKFFPGYLLLNMELYDTNRQINVRVWNFIQDTNGVIGFIGGDRPAPLTDEEVQDVMDQVSGAEEAAKPRIEFELNDIVKIKDGPFENFEGKIESIDPARGRLKLAVAIFGRSTPVEVEY